MTTYEKFNLGLKTAIGVLGIVVSIWVGGIIKDASELMANTGVVLERVETLIDMGPEKIADVGDGLGAAAEKTGEGVTEAATNFLKKIKEN